MPPAVGYGGNSGGLARPIPLTA